MLASVPGSQKHPSSREMYGRLRGSGSLRGAFLGSDVILAQQGVSVSFQSRYGAIISMVSLTKSAPANTGNNISSMKNVQRFQNKVFGFPPGRFHSCFSSTSMRI